MTTMLASTQIPETSLPAAPVKDREVSYSRLFRRALLKGILVALGLLAGAVLGLITALQLGLISFAC